MNWLENRLFGGKTRCVRQAAPDPTALLSASHDDEGGGGLELTIVPVALPPALA
jgi:hypothetical protein